MFALFKRRMVVIVLGLILLSLLIWFAGDYVIWLESTPNRLFAMAAPVGLVAMWEVFKRAKASQANSQLTAAVVNQAKGDQRPSGDVVQLRERFEEAIATLRQQKKRGGLGLYELPWYVIIGAPGSGKTTALKYSGLKFPLEQRSGRGALRGVGGTRNCDWWFTEEAVLLDTAGRYTTQDSDASADSAGWAEFLALLKKYRKRRPLNGVLLAISAQDLMTQGQAGREAHVAAARRRLNELNKELRIQLPVYVLVTKCDLVAGFAEYFDDMSQDDRAQVLGVTFPQEVTLAGEAANAFPAEFDAVVQRLNERVYSRLEDERDSRRRAKIFGFPQQMASLREGLADFVGEIFESTRFDQRVLLRGVYFTSGTQEGTPIDRLLGALGRRLAVSAEAVAPPGKGKAYFIERLMKQVVLAESGLAGVSRRLEIQKAVAQFGLYVGMLAAGAICLLLLIYSYRTNRAFLTDFKARATEVGRTLPPAGDSAISARPRLDRIRGLVDAAHAYREDRSWLARGWGLDQSDSIEEAAGNIYREELSQSLVKTVRGRIEQRLESLINGGDALDLYESLRAYLMLGATTAAYFRPDEVRDVAKREWETIYRGSEEDIRALDDHFSWLLTAGLPASDVNDVLVDRARSAIPEDASPRLILARVKRLYAESNPPAGPLLASQVFRGRGGRALGEGHPGIFTEPGFRAAEQLIKDTETRFSEEDWVWAGRGPKSRTDVRQQVQLLYEDEYIRQWTGLLQNIGLPAGAQGSAFADFIIKIASEREGLKQLLQVVDRHTYLVPPADGKTPTPFLGSLGGWIDGQWQRLRGRPSVFGARITDEFTPIHLLVTPIEGKVAIDETLAKLKDMGTKLNAMQTGVVGGKVDETAAAGLSQAAQELEQSAGGLPGPAASISALIKEVGGAAEKASGGQVQTSVRTRFQNVVTACKAVINNRYPFFVESRDEVTPQNLEDLFGSSGEYSRFLKEDLAAYVEQRNGQYVALRMPSGNSVGIDDIVRVVNLAERIREAFFPGGQARFRFALDVRELDQRSLKFELSDILFEDGKRLTFENTKMNPKYAVWPTKPGELAATFIVDQSGRSQSVREDGAWSLFRLIDRLPLEKQTDTVFLWTIRSGESWARIRLTAERQANPLNLIQARVLQNFRCDR